MSVKIQTIIIEPERFKKMSEGSLTLIEAVLSVAQAVIGDLVMLACDGEKANIDAVLDKMSDEQKLDSREHITFLSVVSNIVISEIKRREEINEGGNKPKGDGVH